MSDGDAWVGSVEGGAQYQMTISEMDLRVSTITSLLESLMEAFWSNTPCNLCNSFKLKSSLRSRSLSSEPIEKSLAQNPPL